ncbi:MAG: cyanophycin synthetase, partial [Arenimonas sp.]
VAGRFDHYICRRDDGLRGRDGDEVPRIQARALKDKGVPDSAISIIPDEQEAIDAALRMGQPGDLMLIFADALVRSWKQIIKFRPEGAAPERVVVPSAPVSERVTEDNSFAMMEGISRDERGIFISRESDD